MVIGRPSYRATVALSPEFQSDRRLRSIVFGHSSFSTASNGTEMYCPSSIRFFKRFSSGSPPSPSGGQPLKLRSNGCGLLGMSGSAELFNGLVERERRYLTSRNEPRKVTTTTAAMISHEDRVFLLWRVRWFIRSHRPVGPEYL